MNSSLNSSLIDNPSQWRLSLMIAAGIDVFATRFTGERQTVAAKLKYDLTTDGVAAQLEELVYSNPMLLLPFGKVDIVYSGGFTLVVPEGTSPDNIDKLFRSAEPSVTLTAPVDSRNQLLYRVDRRINNFVRRTFGNVNPTHSLSVLGRYFSHRSRLGNNSKMYVDLGADGINVLVFNQLGLAMASSFVCRDINDAAYYVLASAKTAGLDFGVDEIRIAGNADRRAALMPVLRKFVRHVMPAIFPSEANTSDSAALNSPFSLVIMPLCE